ncbi:pancreatic secretory granule membrane major glycoprotein GP2-like isoform X2 [Mobula hypostoma]|uniref:pancreatic secretory granule membrane major glycoprotein GP2-like isoform X2 n=1 Tax=Mobula hypostoma TaxID=723540 RepID=UPI002FC353B1
MGHVLDYLGSTAPTACGVNSGGWRIPETAVPTDKCSGTSPGWLNGHHPSVGEGEVNRTVCFSWEQNNCDRNRTIKIKNCGDFFVYWLKPTLCCDKVYCTDPQISTSEEAAEHTQEPSSVPVGDTSTVERHSESSTKGPIQETSSAQEKEMCPVKGLPTKEKCEKMINTALVLYVRQSNLENSEEYFQQIREMLIEQTPCKYVLSKYRR